MRPQWRSRIGLRNEVRNQNVQAANPSRSDRVRQLPRLKGSLNMGESFRDLLAWQRAIELAVAVYGLTGSFPPAQRFGLFLQLPRASVSVASNIAEGPRVVNMSNFWVRQRIELRCRDATGHREGDRDERRTGVEKRRIFLRRRRSSAERTY
jgi:hypothetical protein